VRTGAIIFVEIPVRDLARAADFYAGMFGWSFEDDADSGWFFASGSGGPMGRITTSRPAGLEGVRFTVAVSNVSTATSRAIALGGGTAGGPTSAASDVGDFALLVDPDGNRFGIFQGKLRRRDHPGHHESDAADAG
jgi:predicted enzyme related to lactoylglutathione lyase